MARQHHRCAYCGMGFRESPIIADGLDFCSEACIQRYDDHPCLRELPSEFLEHKVAEASQVPCPKCGGPGPINAVSSHRVFSFFFITYFATNTEIGCVRCGRRQCAVDAALCLLLGAWGFPIGVIGAPIQCVRNIRMIRSLSAGDPFKGEFRRTVLDDLAHRLEEEDSKASAATP
ncbi:hypothetical protein Mal64_31280 [Pseudobythopirellula maris]|uniref:Uncharacterized protein n=1 Tax=Pseudobythopirellula maris TaxID=2527991 RepID=A0A5C5ZK66_9BACT|nr:hypothetical protein Mal64_31280 [Pseudobythopirellula maris]